MYTYIYICIYVYICVYIWAHQEQVVDEEDEGHVLKSTKLLYIDRQLHVCVYIYIYMCID